MKHLKRAFSTSFSTINNDLPAGIAVFFVAVPLCLGIAHASGAPLISGLITGVIGGVITGFISKSALSVSGPAAGLTAIAISSIATLGSFEAFLLAIFIAGAMQIVFAAAKAGSIATYIPNTVIKGMLSAIGLILIIKQFPHLIGYDIEVMGVEEFTSTPQDMNDGVQKSTNTFSTLAEGLLNLNNSVLTIGLLSLVFLIVWDKFFQPKYKTIPGALLVVVLGVALHACIQFFIPTAQLDTTHLVTIPQIASITDFRYQTSFPNWSQLSNFAVYTSAFTIAVVASIETLLSTEAIDKLDPEKRKTPANRELLAQGIGNMLAGLFGGLPMTAVIVRGSVNVSAGARTKLSTIFHGVFIVIAVVFLTRFINLIPLASLAAVLIYTGYKLLSPEIIIQQFKKGWLQFIPFAITLAAIVLTDLLTGVTIGLVVSLLFIVYENYKGTVLKLNDMGIRKRIVLGEDITFLHKSKIVSLLESVPEGAVLEIDGSRTHYIDKDILEIIQEYKVTARKRNIELIIGGLKQMENEDLKELMRQSYDRLFTNNEKWVNAKLMEDPAYFQKLSKGQTPQYLFIGCSDSRVPANEITGTDPGEMFVHRNIANMVVNTDINMLSVVQYSVEVLNVKHIIVCGHYGCGGVKAAVEHKSNGIIDKWLRNIKDVYRLHKDELDSIADPELRHRRLVEVNVKEQVMNLMKTSFIQRNRTQYGFPEVHGWVYDISNGRLIDLNVDIDKEFPDYHDIYEINIE
ncbi:MAG: SulP family inorganic anion transporter [Bacteroidia bacterium]|jgi:carbonic anhydrase|nr:SulP family inorganic anion transporter [Bacteroidia bacterium]